VTAPVTRQILAFLAQKSKECWQKAPPHDSCVTQGLKHSSIEEFPTLFLPTTLAYKLLCCPHGYLKGRKQTNILQISTALLFNPTHKISLIWTLSP
jgi:hypothetical protein